jgi:hypothetical protein
MREFRAKARPRNLPGILQQVGLEALTRGKAYAAGEVIWEFRTHQISWPCS